MAVTREMHLFRKDVKAVIGGLKKLRDTTAVGASRGLRKAAAFVLRESQKIVPVDTGALRASGRVVVEGEGFGTRCTVSYNTDYAIYVHEDLNAAHRPGKTAKYLVRVIVEQRDQIVRIAVDEARRHIRVR